MSGRKRAGAANGAPRRGPFLPAVDKVLGSDAGRVLSARFGHRTAVDTIRRTLTALRPHARNESAAPIDPDRIAVEALNLAQRGDEPKIRRVFNLTGTVLHTNLGRAILPEAAIEAAVQAMRHAVALEFDLETGRRGERDEAVRGLICELTGAEDCCVVNNNAGAVFLALNSLAQGSETIVSRGELIEIGGSFRLPDIMARAGTRLVEAGTTNRTHLKDYEQAIGDRTALILKAHTSNYIVQGFTKSVPVREIAPLAGAKSIPVIHDLGSGALVDPARYGLAPEQTVAAALAEGADLVTFSGDKLLGGPQVGIAAGRKDLIAKLSANPIRRALRADKIRLAALEATLKLYRDPDRLPESLPALKAFMRARPDIAAAATRVLPYFQAAIGSFFNVAAVPCASQIGSGSLPLETLPSAGLAITPANRKDSGRLLLSLAGALRKLPIPVLGRIHDGALILDFRCLDDERAFINQLPMLDLDPEKDGSAAAEVLP